MMLERNNMPLAERVRKVLCDAPVENRVECAKDYCRGVIHSDKSKAEKDVARMIGQILEPDGIWYMEIKVTVGGK